MSDPTEVAEALNSQYTSQFTREPDGHLPDMDGEPVSSMPDIEFTAPGIEKLLNNLNPSKASGPDLVPARILIRPQLEYAALVWHPFHETQIAQVEKVQRTAARWTCRRWKNTTSVGDMYMLDELEWPSLEARRGQSS